MIPPIEGKLGDTITISGYANDYDRRIVAMQFSLDEGQNWVQYDEPDTTMGLNLDWTFTFTPEKTGAYTLLVRSVNEDGISSPEPAVVHITVH